jgi:hypothetical protein
MNDFESVNDPAKKPVSARSESVSADLEAPVDVKRTTRAHAGQALKHGHNVPGLVAVAVAVAALVIGLASLATGHEEKGLLIVLAAAACAALGLGWLTYTHRKVRAAEIRWYERHSHRSAPPPAS